MKGVGQQLRLIARIPVNRIMGLAVATFVFASAVLLMGCGNREESIAKKVGEVLGQQATDFTKGVGKGIDQQMMIEVSLSPEVKALGITNTIAKSLGIGTTNGISIYFIASQNISNTLIARALNTDGIEVGRAKKVLVMEKNDGNYVTFNFEDQMDTAMVKRYEIGL